MLGHESVSSGLHPARRLIRPLEIVREDTLFIGLINHAELLDEATCGAHHGAFVLLDHQTVGLAAISTLVLFHVALRLR